MSGGAREEHALPALRRAGGIPKRDDGGAGGIAAHLHRIHHGAGKATHGDFMIDRELQRKVLEELREAYPGTVTDFRAATEGALAANLAYLKEHGLAGARIFRTSEGLLDVVDAWITARGIDFLEDDGGLSAILGTVTVRLHADTIRDLLAAKVEEADIPAEEKSLIRKHLASLPEAALKAATTRLIETGLSSMPNAVQWLRTLSGL